MENHNKLSFIAITVMAVMAIVSFTNLFGLNLSSVAIIIGIAFFFICNAIEKQPMKGSGLDFMAIGEGFRNKKIWLWLVLPLIADAICVLLAILFLPEYIEYETTRAGAFVAIEISVKSILMFFLFALGEEIAWRAFFQNRLSKRLPAFAAVLITSLLFTLGHYKRGDISIVLFGLLFTFLNSVLYGIIFHKAKNAWISTISHFTANIFEVILFIIIANG
ncbi:MAG: CPBP family intramembrane glutamic endopeptidase [Christensenellales bacterium]|jgi:membrane protease YdiL (CAAX protease family)